MDRERARATREKLRSQELRLYALTMNLPEGASELSDDMIAALIELEDLHHELEFLQNDSPDPGEPEAFVGAPVRRPPHLNSGAIALPEPDEPGRRPH